MPKTKSMAQYRSVHYGSSHSSWIYWLSLAGIGGGVAGFIFSFFVLPLRTVQSLCATWHPTSYQKPLLILSLALAFFSFMLSVVFARGGNAYAISAPHYGFRWQRYFKWTVVGFCGLVLLEATAGLWTPLDVDENIHAASLARGDFWREIDPFHLNPSRYTQNHPLAQLVSAVFMEMFGFNKVAGRLPALLFTIVLLSVLYRATSHRFRAGVLALLPFLHLASNQFAIWYLHSMRGYVSMMCFALLCFSLLWDLTDLQIPWSASKHLFFILALFLCSMTNTFGAIFCTLLIGALIFWAWLNIHELDTHQIIVVRKIILHVLWVAPLLVLLFGFKTIFLKRIGDFNAIEAASVMPAWGEAFGVMRSWALKAALWMFLGVLLCLFLQKERLRKDFGLIFLLLAVISLSVLFWGFQVRVVKGRFLLAFIMPAMLWLAWAIERIERPAIRLALSAIALFVFVCVPLSLHKESGTSVAGQFSHFDDFIYSVRGKTAPVGENCYTFSGKEDLVVWAEYFYFSDAKKQKEDCRHRYHLQLGRESLAEVAQERAKEHEFQLRTHF